MKRKLMSETIFNLQITVYLLLQKCFFMKSKNIGTK